MDDAVNTGEKDPSQLGPDQPEEKSGIGTETRSDRYVFRLYVADRTPKSVRAIQQLQQLCNDYLEGRYDLEVIDIYQQPERLEKDQIFATPTLIKELPPPLQRLIGDMTDIEQVLISLDL